MLNSTVEGSSSILIPDLFPRVYRLPVNKAVSLLSTNEYVGCWLTLSRRLVEQVITVPATNTTLLIPVLRLAWTASQQNSSTSCQYLFRNPGPVLLTLSTEVPSDILTRQIVTVGIVGLYLGVVLAIGRLLRGAVSNLVQRILYDDMPNVEYIEHLCEDVFTARKYGNLRLEEELYKELITLYRDPQRLIEVTRKHNKPKND